MLDKVLDAAHDARSCTVKYAVTYAVRNFPWWDMSQIEFKSHVPVAQKTALEALLFFNSCQERVSACIADAIEKFGAPEIVADRDRLRIHVKGLPDVQSLFALDARTGRPVGVAVYARQD